MTNARINNDDSRPTAEKASRLTGPKWAAADGSEHAVTFHRLHPRADTWNRARSYSGWQAVHLRNGEVWEVIELADTLTDVCDTSTGALWALRGIVANRMMEKPARSTRGH